MHVPKTFNSGLISINDIAILLNQRLLIMRDVARYKFQHNMPVEDLKREEDVMKIFTKQAVLSGMEKKSIQEFSRALMDISKSTQYRYFSDWIHCEGEYHSPVETIEELRGVISLLDSVIIQSFENRFSKNHFTPEEIKVLPDLITAYGVSGTDKFALSHFIGLIRLNP